MFCGGLWIYIILHIVELNVAFPHDRKEAVNYLGGMGEQLRVKAKPLTVVLLEVNTHTRTVVFFVSWKSFYEMFCSFLVHLWPHFCVWLVLWIWRANLWGWGTTDISLFCQWASPPNVVSQSRFLFSNLVLEDELPSKVTESCAAIEMISPPFITHFELQTFKM